MIGVQVMGPASKDLLPLEKHNSSAFPLGILPSL